MPIPITPITTVNSLWQNCISIKEVMILNHIHTNGPTKPGELRPVLGDCQSAIVTNGLDALERKGLITRANNPEDRRSTLASNTAAGSAMLKKLKIT